MRVFVILCLVTLPACASTGGTKTAPATRTTASAPKNTASTKSTTSSGKGEVGEASYYASKHHGLRTASGEVYDQAQLTAAHRTLPFGTKVRVTNLSNDRSVVFRINDRGPFIKGRIVDVSRRGAVELGFLQQGIAQVRVQVVD